jgi:hypothetical protein
MDGDGDLRDVMQIFGMDVAGAAHLMGVAPEVLATWLVVGVSAPEAERVATIAAAARSLRAFFKPERIPTIVTEAVPAFGGRSVLDVVATDPARVIALVAETRLAIVNTPEPEAGTGRGIGADSVE